MKPITSASVTEFDTHQFCTEASELGLKPGEWPEKLETTMGNKLDFVRVRPLQHNGEFAGYYYTQMAGCISLQVFND